MPLIPDDSSLASHHNTPSPPEHLVTRSTPTSAIHSRETSAVRGRAADPSTLTPSTLQPQSNRRGQSHSKSPDPAAGRPGIGYDVGLERRPSHSYGHHRQTSIVHGIQHSRNPSFAASSTSTSPLSPELIASLGRGTGNDNESAGAGQSDQHEMYASHQSPGGNGSSQSLQSTLSTTENQDAGEIKNPSRAGSVHKRMNSAGKSWRERSHSRSHSRQHQVESKTVGEYALHHLFNSFVGQADNKVNQAIMKLGRSDAPVEEVCGPGVDPNFDQLIAALGHISRQKPKPLIDTIMLWRKAKGDAATMAKQTANQKPAVSDNGLIARRNTEPTQIATDPAAQTDSSAPNPMLSRHEDVILAERRATVSVYLVCRVLIEIFNQSNIASITVDMAERLEDIVFGQLKTGDPDQISASPLRMANWRIYSQLLGIMSETNFTSVANRFLAELERYQKEEMLRGPSKEGDSRVELLILGMRHLRVRTHQEAWGKSCDFMRALARLFATAHGQRVKQAYCYIFEKLLLPIAASPNCDLGSPKWKEFLESVQSRLSQMLAKPRHWATGFPLHVLLLCVSSKEVFSSQWLSVIQSLPARLKDRPTRAPALQAMCRLLWTYFFRYTDSPTVTLRKVEEVARIALPAGKRTYLSTEPAVSEPLIHLIRLIGFKHPDVCFRNIIFPLINSDLFLSGKELKIEQMEPEKMVIGIRSFLAIVTDLENCDQLCPPFLTGSIPNPFTDIATPVPFHRPQLLADPRLPNALEDRDTALSLPVNTSRLSDNVKEYYIRFCDILGKITLLCDNTFGGQAALDEKFGGTTPKTPISEAFSFGRRDDHLSVIDQRQGFYDLLHVAVQTLPRCLSDRIPFNSLINLLCTGTAHVQSNIASSSAESLKAIARQSHAQQVTIGFARFIFNFDARYSTMSDEGMLGPGHIESTLRLYVQLLQIWIEEIKHKTKGVVQDPADKSATGSRALQLDLSSIWAHVEEIESHGLFFLCSQSRRVRAFAITVLRLITEFDSALGKENTRIIRILEADANQILNVNDEQLTVAERSRIQKGKRKSASHNTLIELCSSEVSYDSTLWSKVFPNIIKISFETCPFAVTLGREIVCARLVQMHKTITALAESSQSPQYAPIDPVQARALSRSNMTAEILIEQWKLYLVMACTTLNSVGAQSQSQLANAQHARKSSKGAQQSQDKISSARSLFAFVIPLLSAERSSIRNAIVIALGSINKNLYRTLLESLQYAVTTCNEEAKVRIGVHHRSPSSPRRNRKTDRLRTEVTHVYKLTSHFLQETEVYNDDWIVNNLLTYTKDLRIFLSDAEVQNDWEFQRLRFHYCGLMEELFEGINRTKDPSHWIPFESRKSAFSLMEDWCGYSPNQAQISQREDNMRKFAMNQQSGSGEIRNTAAAMEIEKKNLRAAALSAMASLCAGPISITTESGAVLQFDVGRMLSWIDIIFNTISDKWHGIGRRALKNLTTHNKEHSYLLERSIEMCYVAERPKALESYFEVVTQVLIEHTDYPLGFWRILGAVLVTLGNQKREIRMKSAKLLRILEERQQKSSRLQDFDISISDKTTAVYKLAQFETSKRLAKQHSDLAFTLFSEFSLHFRNLGPDSQRNMVAAILPWVQTMELQVDPNGGPTARSYMLLANLFEITIRCSSILPNEVQALWQALATGPHGGNVQLVLDFIISLCLERKEQNFVEYAKQVVVFLSGTPAGSKVIEFFLMQLVPKNMVQERKDITPAPPDIKGLPYVADLGTVLPVGNKQAGLSLGQVALIFLVDLMVAPVTLPLEEVVKLLHVVLILWDHYTLTVQEQAREMLVHLIHELIAAKIEDDAPAATRQSIEDFVESIRKSDSTVVWEYEDNNDKEDEDDESRVPPAMSTVTRQVVNFFSFVYEGINDLWAKEALNWATSCPVRHLACRSFQVFRCISTSLNPRMLADMLARLSNTIADEESDYQTFSMEILTTLKIIISSLAPADLLRYPQLFWTTCACLNTIHETEFIESIGMLEKFLDSIDMSDPMVVTELIQGQPPKWEGGFEGLQALVYKGLKSSESLNRTLDVLHRLSGLPNNELTGDSDRLLFTILANMAHFLHQFDEDVHDPKTLARATLLARVAEGEGCPRLAASLLGLANGQYKTESDFLNHIITEIRSYYFPRQDVQSLIFLMGLLTNTTNWFRVKVMRILCVLMPELDMRRPEVTSHGPDLISPLLRLLQTDLCPQALQVMDHIMTVSGNPMERHHIRMSMASSSSSRAIRKEYERIQSLYGIPEPTGWSIPMPATQSSITRHNVHAVFYTCAEVDRMEVQETVTPEVEFHADEYNDAFFPLRADTMKSMDTQMDGNMGDIVQKLDSLDEFFEETEPINPGLDAMPDSTLRGFAGAYADTSASLYDQQTAPILRKSLARTASTSSFHNGLAEPRPPNMRFDSVGVHSPNTTTTQIPSHTLRPTSHTRSVTSPANSLFSPPSHPQYSTPPIGFSESAFLSDDEIDDGIYEFDERLTISKPTILHPNSQTRSVTDGSSSLESMIRSGMRRLTGGAATNREKERQRDMIRAQQRAAVQAASSPRVPKVPPEYLVGPTSNPTSPGQ
ncbi:putative cell morphogenesis protein (PAG1) [Aspergillus clavatus NRRL 1]|uniref:Cell morphogenesis protein (PAG1), putative n=1 Tax=Aspergillus clavatus (strain ATCC 1007 / CBS 513.65 / DSM 816 / NCTC 3887 / NRRL 1 / QM 1276 / 107) TaxID=344612 RepID=A1CTY7_ASPCL|nr:cell morphogenesis protein (PAG1), putative [Aspergillus clavatus NRRL 1]EAW06774.1 cell morphogenesis protein (PAG1), putative [Aspergillus clavatus NRRL 1]